MVEDRLVYALDESLGLPIAGVLRTIRAPGTPHIHDLRELGLGGTTDPVMMVEVRNKDVDVVVTRDSRILAASVRRDAWRAASLTLMILDGKWGNLPLFELTRRLVWWWPTIVRQAEDGPQGAAWRIGIELRESDIRREFAEVA